MKTTQTAMELLWTEPAQPKRGPRPTLTLPMIAAAGVELADEVGLQSVTMEAVAQRLGVTKMALYRYVPGKAELVALMVEVAIGPPSRASKRGRSWRASLRAWSRELFTKFCDHPWSLEATIGSRPVGPNEVSWLDAALATLVDTGLRGAEKLDVVVTLMGHVRHLAEQHAVGVSNEAATLEGLRVLLEGQERGFDALRAVLSEPALEGGSGAALDFGLDRILDGVEVLVAKHKRKRGSPR
jgi:AcrR family transcriptional regulator